MLDFVTWTANPVLFDHGVTIRWYGLMFVIGFLIGYKIVERIFRHEGAPDSDMYFSMHGTIIRNTLSRFYIPGKADLQVMVEPSAL